MAQAVGRLWPGTKLTIGPSIDSGFYYDFDSEHNFSAEDLIAIEAEMKKIIKEALPIERFTLPRDEALALMKDEPYKCELITELPEGEEISFYRQGDFVDLCAGPHLPDTGRVKAVKLLSATGAYWRGDSKNKMLQRIYGIAFPKTADLQAHLEKLEEAKSGITTSSAGNWSFSRRWTSSARGCPSCCQRARGSSSCCSGLWRTRSRSGAIS